jgi:large subunit ribosomal protein L18
MKQKRGTTRRRAKIKIRQKLSGTVERPRLTVYRSLNHMYAQLVDDQSGATIAAASTRSGELKDEAVKLSGVEKSKKVGELIAKKAGEKNVKAVVFDRNGYRYHGKVKAVAEAAREGGLKF